MNSLHYLPKMLFGVTFFLIQTVLQAQVPIYTWQDLHAIRNNLTGHYVLMNNLGPSDPGYQTYAGDAAHSGMGWEPIGTMSHKFSGMLDGNGYTIDGLRISRSGSDEVGLFGVISGGAIQNLQLTDINYRGRDGVGALAGAVVGVSGAAFNWLFQRCSVIGTIQARHQAGGLVGSVTGTQPLGIVHVFTQVYLTGGHQLGGIAGELNTAQLLILQASSATTCEGLDGVGGFIGHANNAVLNIRNSFSYGRIQGTLAKGGVVGKSTGGDYQHDGVYWDMTSAQQALTAQPTGILGLTTGEMRGYTAADFMTLLDIQCVWELNEFDYPTLSAPTPMELIFETSVPMSGISLPLSGTVAVRADWGDGSFSDVHTAGILNHTYQNPGQYTVRIYYQLSQFGTGAGSWPNADKLVEVVSFGCTALRSLSGAFHGAIQLDRVPQTVPAGITDLSHSFRGATAFDQDISLWDVSLVTNMTDMFLDAGLSTENYDALLISWSAQDISSGVHFHAGNALYTCGQEAEAARWRLISAYGWSIQDGGSSALEQWPDIFAFIVDEQQALGDEISLALMIYDGTELLNFNGQISMQLLRADGVVADETSRFAVKGVALFDGLLLDTPGQYTLRASLCSQQYQGLSAPIQSYQLYGGELGDGHALAELSGCVGGAIVRNEDTGVNFCTIQEAIDDVGTLSGHTITIPGGEYQENINTNDKQLRLVPGPGCVDIIGGLILSEGDRLFFNIAGADACSGVPQVRVTGQVQLNDAQLAISDTEESTLTLMTSTEQIIGSFANRTLVSNAIRAYQINYGQSIQLSPCCDGLLDLGVFKGTRSPDAINPAGHKLEIRVRPRTDIAHAVHAAGIFTLRSLTENNIVFSNLGGAAQAYEQVNTMTDGPFTYYFFSFEQETAVNWLADEEYSMVWLSYDCSIGDALIELSNDAFTLANNGGYYQELGPEEGPFVEAQGIFYAPSVQGPARLTLSIGNDGPVCTIMPLQLSSQVSGGSPDYGYQWSGPQSFSSTEAAPLLNNVSIGQAGVYTLQVIDGNGCEAFSETQVVTVEQSVCVYNETRETYFSTINRAIQDEQTENGDVLYVPPGSYREQVYVSKSLNIRGNNALISCMDGARQDETMVDAAMGTAFEVAADAVSIRGFHIRAGTGIRSEGVSGLHIGNNRIDALREGMVVSDAQEQAIAIHDNCVNLAVQAWTRYSFEGMPEDWYDEAYGPAEFSLVEFDGDQRLELVISADDCTSCRPQGFQTAAYDLQGRGMAVFGALGVSVAIYIPASWESSTIPKAAFSGILWDEAGEQEFRTGIRYASGRWEVWDGVSWIGLLGGIWYDGWNELQMSVHQDKLRYVVGEARMDISLPAAMRFQALALQGYNSSPGEDYRIYWDNLEIIGGTAADVNQPSRAIVLSEIGGSAPALVLDNRVSNAWYGYQLYAIQTEERSVIGGGVGTGLMQGLMISNSLHAVDFAYSRLAVADMVLEGFSGSYASMGDLNFQAGVYAWAGGLDTTQSIDLVMHGVSIRGTGYGSEENAGILLKSAPGGTAVRLWAEVCTLEDHYQTGIRVSGPGAVLSLTNSILRENGFDPADGMGYGLLLTDDGEAWLQGNFIRNPEIQVSGTVVALAVDGGGARLQARENHLAEAGAGTLTANTGVRDNFQATCNWWGSGFVNTVDDAVMGNVLFVPFLRDDNDTEPLVAGYQPSASACRNPERWYINDQELTADQYTFALGNDEEQGTRRRPFGSIGRGLSAAMASDTILVDAGIYDEILQIPASLVNLQLWGAGDCENPEQQSLIKYTDIADPLVEPVLLHNEASGVVVDRLAFAVNLSMLNGGIWSSERVTLRNNCITAYQSVPGTYHGTYEERNAIRIAGGSAVTFADNYISGALFRAGISLWQSSGAIVRNRIQVSGRDVEILEAGLENIVFGGSSAEGNQLLGGGVLLSGTVPGSGHVVISHNYLSGASVAGDTALLVCRDNLGQVAVLISDNELEEVRWGMSLENFNNVAVRDNIFRPAEEAVDFRLLTVNTKSISRSGLAVPKVTLDADITGNYFYSNYPLTGGIALAFYNHDHEEASIGTISLGAIGAPNTFAVGFRYMVYLGDEQGSSILATEFPEYQLLGVADTPMDCWPRDIDIQQNLMDMGSGVLLPSLMNYEQRSLLEEWLYHDVDEACLGTLVYFIPVELAIKVLLQGAYNPLTGRMNDQLRQQGLIPLEEPYAAIRAQFPASFEAIPHHIMETTTPEVLAVAGPNAVVDWIWVELRPAQSPETVLATRSGLLQADGDVVDMDGISPLVFGDVYIGQYYVMVRHRNHLGAMTAAPVDIDRDSGAFVDFSSAALPTYGLHGLAARRALGSGIYGLYAGNTLPRALIEISPGVFSPGPIEIKYNGQHNDRVPILNAVGSSNPLQVVMGVYALEDVNMDGQIKYNGQANDRVLILNNVGASTPLNFIRQAPDN